MNEAFERHTSLIATVLLSLSALATSWAGYQATKWSGDQMVMMTQSNALRAKSTLAASKAGQLRLVDVGVFTAWLDAYVHRDTVLATVFERRFRPEFKPAFSTWMASDPLHVPGAAPTPFVLPEYRLALSDSARLLERASDSVAALSITANHRSDLYVLNAVLFAAVMFFAQAVQQSARPGVRLLLLLCAFGLAATGAFRLIQSPVA